MPGFLGKIFNLRNLISCLLILGIFAVIALAIASAPFQAGKDQNTDTGSNILDPSMRLDPEVYQYAYIKEDDTLAISGQQSAEVVINLAHLQWRDIHWSPDGTRIAALGDVSDNGRYDLYIYEFSNNEWTKATVFESVKAGINGYSWVDADSLVFVQGEKGSTWVHTYNVPNNEIKKVFQVEGVLGMVNLTDRQIVLSENAGTATKPSLSFKIYNFAGELLSSIDATEVAQQTETSGVRMTEIVSAGKENQFLISAEVGLNPGYFHADIIKDTYIQTLNSDNLTKVDLLDTATNVPVEDVADLLADPESGVAEQPTTPDNLRPLCSYNSQLFSAFIQKPSFAEIEMVSINFETKKYAVFAELKPGQQFVVNTDNSFCYQGSLYLATDFVEAGADERKWFVVESNLQELPLLHAAVSLSVK